MFRLAAVLLALMTAPVAAAELDAGPSAVPAVEGPLQCGVPYSLPINATCAQYEGEVCTLLAHSTCWTLRLVCTDAKGPVEYASGGMLTCGQQPGCCDSCQGANCTNATRFVTGPGSDCANYGIHGEIQLGDTACPEGCENHGIHVDVAVGDKRCGSGCTNHGVEVEVRLGAASCGNTCENTGISAGIGGKTCQPGLVWICAGSRCFWSTQPDVVSTVQAQGVHLEAYP